MIDFAWNFLISHWSKKIEVPCLIVVPPREQSKNRSPGAYIGINTVSAVLHFAWWSCKFLRRIWSSNNNNTNYSNNSAHLCQRHWLLRPFALSQYNKEWHLQHYYRGRKFLSSLLRYGHRWRGLDRFSKVVTQSVWTFKRKAKANLRNKILQTKKVLGTKIIQ